MKMSALALTTLLATLAVESMPAPLALAAPLHQPDQSIQVSRRRRRLSPHRRLRRRVRRRVILRPRRVLFRSYRRGIYSDCDSPLYGVGYRQRYRRRRRHPRHFRGKSITIQPRRSTPRRIYINTLSEQGQLLTMPAQ